MNKLSFLKLVIIIATLTSSLYAGGGNRVGTAGSTQLLIPVGPRGIAMGYTTVTDSRGVEAIFWNPANLSLDAGTEVLFSHMSYIADIGVEYGALSVNTGKFGAIGLSIKALSIGDLQVTTADNPDGTGEYFTPQFLTTGLTYSIMLSDRIAIGITGNLNFERLALVSKNNISFNAGISYNNLGNIDGLVIGIVIKNLGPQSSYSGTGLNISSNNMPNYNRTGQQYYSIEAASDDLPTTLELGVGYRYSINESNSLRINGLFQNSNYYYDEYRVGAEYAFNDVVFLRGGYVFTPEVTDNNAKETTLTAGFGVKLNLGTNFNVNLDYGFQKRVLFNDSHVFGVRFSF